MNLKECNIQKYSEDIKDIINQAHTEDRYEQVFLSIKDEWEKAELKIVPFKETLKDFVVQNTDTMIEAIEENINTLNGIGNSKFAQHIQTEISELENMLKKMLHHIKQLVLA
jgi:Dynein heavy chain, N-terminal region 2